MSTEENNQAVADDTSNAGGEGEFNNGGDNVVTLNKAEYDKMLTDLGSLKRENKALKKPKETSDTPEKTNNDNSELLEKIDLLAMKAEGIKSDDEIELAKKLQKETSLPMDKLLSSKYFQSELNDLRTERANAEATSGIKGDKSGGNATQSAAYWIAKGEYPTREQVPDRKTRTEIRAGLVNKEKGGSGGKFYNS